MSALSPKAKIALMEAAGYVNPTTYYKLYTLAREFEFLWKMQFEDCEGSDYFRPGIYAVSVGEGSLEHALETAFDGSLEPLLLQLILL